MIKVDLYRVECWSIQPGTGYLIEEDYTGITY